MADKMLRMAGRDSTGKAKPIKTDALGNIGVQVEKSQTEILTFDSANPFLNAASHQLRDTAEKDFRFPQVEKGIIEQSFFILNQLNAELNVNIRIGFGATTGDKFGGFVYTGTIPVNGRFAFIPEKSYHREPQSPNGIIEIPELRMPIPKIIFVFSAKTAPTTGDISITNVRRY